MRLAAALFGLWASAAASQTITQAEFGAPTQRYGHAILGDAIEFGSLSITMQGGAEPFTITLPKDHVFEDVAPRLWDVDGDGAPEVVVVETDVRLGGSLAIYDAKGKIAETPHIGRTNRWLAPIGAADMDGDGYIEVAYVDRPHLAKTIRVWRFKDGRLEPVADLPGYTNHRIGEPDIAGGIRTCRGTPEMIVATANWSRLTGVTFDGDVFRVRDLGPHEGRNSFTKALRAKSC